MIIRQLNEFTRESVPLALEPSRKCVASCTYCFAELNSRAQYAGRSKRLGDDGSFERLVGDAYGPNYDPEVFLQWCVRNRLPLGYANTVEPFQDIPQAVACLKLCDRLGLPLFVQTKGVNYDAVEPLLHRISDNSSFFISIPSLDDRVVKRFEPGTPPIQDRLRIISRLADAGCWVIAALSPYHEEWCEDPVALVAALAGAGAKEIFLDRLHLNPRQKATASDRLVVSMAGGRYDNWPPKMIDHLFAMYEEAGNQGLDWYTASFIGAVYGLPNSLSSISPDVCWQRGRPWPYHDGRIFRALEDGFYAEGMSPEERDPSDSVLVTWRDALAIMEEAGPIDQPFSYRSLYDFIKIGRRLPDVWKEATGKHRPAPIRDWFRALWCNPSKNQFFWRHPWVRVACRSDGVLHLDEQGCPVALFDPDCPVPHGTPRGVESLDGFRRLTSEL